MISNLKFPIRNNNMCKHCSNNKYLLWYCAVGFGLFLIGIGTYSVIDTKPDRDVCNRKWSECQGYCDKILCNVCVNCNMTCNTKLCKKCEAQPVSICTTSLCPAQLECNHCVLEYERGGCPQKIKSYDGSTFMLGFGVLILVFTLIGGTCCGPYKDICKC